MTMSDTCATHVLDKGKSESCLVKAPAMHASESVLVVGELLCTGVQANTERHTRNETRSFFVTLLIHVNHAVVASYLIFFATMPVLTYHLHSR